MPTPHEPTEHTRPIPRASLACPEWDALQEAIEEVARFRDRSVAARNIFPEFDYDGITSDGSNDGSTGTTKLSQEDDATVKDIETSHTTVNASRSSSAETESKSEDAYTYNVPRDLGYALTREAASMFTDSIAMRRRPTYPSSFLRPGSKFVGTQKDKQIYTVEVEIQDVDIEHSTICGYLKIDGLTPDFPSLVTFFDSEIVGPHYSFITQHDDWGCTEKSDIAHWDRFAAFKPLAKQAKNPDYYPQNIFQKDNIFMRWKERFLVPDHKISEIGGASYEGFYYICFNQILGTISGIYFHAKSDRYQQLELKHVPDYGRAAHIEWA